MHRIATVISYCTNDYRFIHRCIEEAKKFSEKILIPVCDHFFDGKPENRFLLHSTYERHPSCSFLEYRYKKDGLYNPFLPRTIDSPDWKRLWHSTSRYLCFFYLPKNIEYVLFLDSDEIVDGKKFKKWLDQFPYRKYRAIRPLQYYYFRNSSFQDVQWRISSLFVKKKVITPEMLFHVDERLGVYRAIKGRKHQSIKGLDGKPMIHHYSWVRTKQECLKKSEQLGTSLGKRLAKSDRKRILKKNSRERFCLSFSL